MRTPKARIERPATQSTTSVSVPALMVLVYGNSGSICRIGLYGAFERVHKCPELRSKAAVLNDKATLQSARSCTCAGGCADTDIAAAVCVRRTGDTCFSA